MFESAWYALYVRSRHEKSVQLQLAAKSHEVFLPLYSARHKWADRLKTVSLPLFPGYVFCRFDSSMRTSVMSTSGVIDIVRAGADPAQIATSEINAIQEVVKSPLYVEPYAGLVAGQRVRMCEGPLKGLNGTLLEVRKDFRLVLSVEMLQRSVMVEIQREWVEPCTASPVVHQRLLPAMSYSLA
jgi:transcription antitermination factor NusG